MARRKKKPNSWQPWPAEAYEPYQELVKLYQLLAEDITKSINRGTRAIPRNKFVIEALIDYILQGARQLEETCQVILDILEDERRGRLPKWFTLTEEIQDKTSEIVELATKVKPALMVNKLIYLVDVYDQMKAEIDGISELLETHPYRASLIALEQAADIVNEKWER